MVSPRVSGARLDHLVQGAREPVFWLAADLRVVWVNKAWEELTGHSASAALGLRCQPGSSSRQGDVASLASSLYPPLEALEGRPVGVRALFVHPSGERLWRRVEFWPFHDDKGAISAYLGLIRPTNENSTAPDAESQRARVELLEARERLLARHGIDSLVGRGPAHHRILEQIRTAAETRIPVLIVGDPGTGKRLVARLIHQAGPRPQAPLVPLDCGALPPEVLERELFGSPARPGEEGDGGAAVLPRLMLPEGATLLLGDLLDLPRDLQARLVEALGSPIRVLATMAHDPDAALRAERLRPDLYYAVTTLVLRLPPLRQRLDELGLLAQHLLERANARAGRVRHGFSSEALEVLLAYDWPGNLRELARVVDDAHGRAIGDTIEAGDLPAAIRGNLAAAYHAPPPPPAITPLDELLTQVERRLIDAALQRAHRNKSRAAEFLGISRPRLYRRIKELGMPDEPDPPEETGPGSNGVA